MKHTYNEYKTAILNAALSKSHERFLRQAEQKGFVGAGRAGKACLPGNGGIANRKEGALTVYLVLFLDSSVRFVRLQVVSLARTGAHIVPLAARQKLPLPNAQQLQAYSRLVLKIFLEMA